MALPRSFKEICVRISIGINQADLIMDRAGCGNSIRRFTDWSQVTYIFEVIKKFGMENTNVSKTPNDLGTKLSVSMSLKTEEDKLDIARILYQSLVGCLLFISQGTRLVRILDSLWMILVSKFKTYTLTSSWENYSLPKENVNWKLRFSKSDTVFLCGFCDSDWSWNVDKRRSCTGYFFSLYNGAISWTSKRQDPVIISSSETDPDIVVVGYKKSNMAAEFW